MAGKPVSSCGVALERDGFLRRLVRHLSGALQDTVGLEEAEGFISLVGQNIGEEINDAYREALALPLLDREQVAAVLVDLKRRIQGDFYLISQDDNKLVLGNRRCPFGGAEAGRPALCMMTSNVFGVIVAENLGYARVSIDQAIARGDSECRVTVYLQPVEDVDSGREFFRSEV